MKIAQVVCVYLPYRSGITNSVKNISENMAVKGHDVTVFTPKYQDNLSEIESMNGVKVVRSRCLLKSGHAAIMPGVISKLRDFDIVHLHYPFFGTAEWLASRYNSLSWKPRLVTHYHMDTEDLPFFRKPLASLCKQYFKNIVDRSIRITCASLDYIASSSIKEIYLANKEKFIEIPFGIDTAKFSPAKTNKTYDLIFVGALDKAHDFKGLKILLEAVSRATRQIKVLIIGGGNKLNYYQNLVAKLGLEKQVVFTGTVDDRSLIQHYQNSKILVLPSTNKHEAFGMVLIEAMSCGLPVVASDLPGVRRVFNDLDSGLVFEPGNVKDLAGKLENILANEKLILKMGEKARILAINNYDISSTTDKYVDLYWRLNNENRHNQ